MRKSFILNNTIILAFILLPFFAAATEASNKIVGSSHLNKEIVFQTDSTKHSQEPQDKQKLKKEKQEKADKQPAQKPEISTVPKARKQTRPTVVKPKVIVKPIKVIKPKIKKP